jgi:multidrug efflux pump subunit AcrA (membrane-fusion protein)
MQESIFQSRGKKNMKKARLSYLMISALAVPLILTSCSLGLNKQAVVKQTAVPAVGEANYYTVDKGSIATTLIGTGKIAPTKTTSLYFNSVSGPLDKLNFTLNDQVKTGDLVAELLPTDLQNRIDIQKIVVEKGKLRLLQLDDTGIENLKRSIELAQLELVLLLEQQKNLPAKNDLSLKKAKLALEQFQYQSNSTKISKQISDLDLTSIQKKKNQQQGVNTTTEEDLKRTELRVEQANVALKMIQISIDIAQLALDEIAKTNDEQSKKAAQDIQKNKIGLEQLKLQLESAQKNKEHSRQQAELDQASAVLTLKLLEQNLENSKLFSPVNGLISYMSNTSITDIVGSGQLLAKIADPNQLVFQFIAVDAKYVTGAKSAILTIGTEKYDVDFYTPQPGDSFDQGNNRSASGNNISNLFVKFKKKAPGLKFDEIVQAQLDVKKDNILLIPKTELRVENGKILVDLLRGKEIVTVEIARGIESETSVEVANGLKQGDKIVRR